MRKKVWLWVECIGLFALLPLPLNYLLITPPDQLPIDLGDFQFRRMIFPVLWFFAILAMLAWRRKHRQSIFTKIPWDIVRTKVLPRFVMSLIAMAILTYILDEARFLRMPMERPDLWMLIMVFYPLISVVPQEVIFRLFFFDRYEPIFGRVWGMIFASGLAFGHAHIIFNNWIAYTLSIVGGILFAMTYARSRNLSLVWLEHAIYGQFVFTIGLGWYFYSGAVAAHA